MARSLPATDEAIVAALESIVKSENHSFGLKWSGDETVLSSAAFGGCVHHADLYWFEKKQDGFSYLEGKQTLRHFIKQLRGREKQLAAAA